MAKWFVFYPIREFLTEWQMVMDWLKENSTGRVKINYKFIKIKLLNDATMFKLRWSDYISSVPTCFSFLEVGAFYCPYIPLQIGRKISPNTFQPIGIINV